MSSQALSKIKKKNNYPYLLVDLQNVDEIHKGVLLSKTFNIQTLSY